MHTILLMKIIWVGDGPYPRFWSFVDIFRRLAHLTTNTMKIGTAHIHICDIVLRLLSGRPARPTMIIILRGLIVNAMPHHIRIFDLCVEVFQTGVSDNEWHTSRVVHKHNAPIGIADPTTVCYHASRVANEDNTDRYGSYSHFWLFIEIFFRQTTFELEYNDAVLHCQWTSHGLVWAIFTFLILKRNIWQTGMSDNEHKA